MTKEEAVKALNEVRAGFQSLYAAAREADDDCFWCCGGGDEAYQNLTDKEEEILSLYPDLS